MAVAVAPLLSLTPDQFLAKGLTLAGYNHDIARTSRAINLRRFRENYGSDPIVISLLWHDLQTTDINDAKIEPASAREPMREVEYFLMTMKFLKMYPTEGQIAGLFHCVEHTAREKIKHYMGKIQALTPQVIYWPEEWDDDDEDFDLPVFLCSVDGVHCQIHEPQHPLWSKNPKYYSHKFNKAALNYEIAISVWENRVVWINGPFPGGKHDITVFKEGLMAKIPKDKLVIADRGYVSQELTMISTPNPQDDAELQKFKSRVRSRHEAFNAKIKSFHILSTAFRSGEAKHKIAFEVVCVICQYQLTYGKGLFEP